MLYDEKLYDEELYDPVTAPTYDQYLVRSDTANVGLTEVATVAVVISVTEAINVVVADAYISALALIVVYNHIDVSVLELLSEIGSLLAVTDDIGVSVADAGTVQVAIAGTDDADVAIADASTVVKTNRLGTIPESIPISGSRRQ